jgi:hypothetical protein
MNYEFQWYDKTFNEDLFPPDFTIPVKRIGDFTKCE